MFAILISPENLSKIETAHQRIVPVPLLNLDVYLESARSWYYVRGWYNETNAPVDWTVLPEYIIVEQYEFDPNTIKTNWDQIVRK